jgi:hypothetical protein
MSTALKLVTQPSYRPGDISSPSSCSQYRKCGAFWRFKHIDKLPDPPTDALTQGSAVHAAIGENFRQKIETKKDLPLAGVKALFREAWAVLVKAEFPGPFEDRLAVSQALNALSSTSGGMLGSADAALEAHHA